MMESKYHRYSFFKRIQFRMHRQPRGQSFVELMFVMVFLALLLSGVVEYGFMLNQYLHVLDGSREAARYSASFTGFSTASDGVTIGSYYYPPFYYVAAGKAAQTMDPVLLNPANPDDIVISVFSLDGTTVTRFPGNPNGLPGVDSSGWSLCAHYGANADDANAKDGNGHATPYGGFAAYFPTLTPPAPVPSELPASSWGAGCHVRNSQFSIAAISSLLGSVSLAPGETVLPKTGAVLVEIFYNYPQLLKLPVLTSIVSDPIPLYVYSIMPLSSAQPTQVP
jgi:hypothetical protein